METKKETREKMRRLREGMAKDDVKGKSSLIFSNLLTLPAFFRADVVHTYISSKNNEADTHTLIRWLLKEKKRVIVPLSDKKTATMRHSEIISLSELAVSSLGILEPKIERPFKIADVDVVIVPAVAVDRSGNRLGFGAGFYDRFLHDVQLPTIALAYDFQLMPAVQTEQFDVPVNYVVTDQEIIKCR